MKESTKIVLRGLCLAAMVFVLAFGYFSGVLWFVKHIETPDPKPEPIPAAVPEADLVQLWPQSTPDEPEIVEHVEPTEPAILRVLATSTIIVMPDGTEQSLLGLIRKLERVERLAVEQWHPERQGISP